MVEYPETAVKEAKKKRLVKRRSLLLEKKGKSSDDKEVLSNDALVAIICVSPETRHGRDASQRLGHFASP